MEKSNIEVIRKKVEKECHICYTCGYDKGFYGSLVKDHAQYEIVFVCPECGQRFKIKC